MHGWAPLSLKFSAGRVLLQYLQMLSVGATGVCSVTATRQAQAVGYREREGGDGIDR